MKKLSGIIVVLFFLLSCGKTVGTNNQSSPSDPTATKAAVVETVPESTKLPEVSLTNTASPSATSTVTPQPTSSPTSTPTLEPPTQTALAKSQTQEKKAADKSATAIEKSIRTSATAEVRSKQRTATQIEKNNQAATVAAQKTMIARYQTVEAKKLITYPGDYEGQHIRFDIKIFNFINERTLQGYIIGGYYDPIVIRFKDPYRDIYDDEIITVFGVVSGKWTGTNVYGADIHQILIKDAWFRK